MENNKVKKVRKTSQQFAYTSLQFHEAVSRHAGFAGTDHKYLGFFLQKGSLTAGELSDLTGLTTGAVTGLIDRFEKKKLVKRQYEEKDRRKVIVVPDSKKIMGLLEPYYKEFQKKTEKLLAGFTDSEIEIIDSFLLKSIELMKSTKENLK